MRRILIAAGVFTLAILPLVAYSAATPHFHVERRIALPGDGGWDYIAVDATWQRLFVTHGTHVLVVDLASDSIVGDIPNTPGVHGVAFAPEAGRGFTSNGRDSSVTVFDLKSLAVISRTKLDARFPDAITYEPVSGRVFTFNAGSANTTAINAQTGAVEGTLALGGAPEAGVADGTGRVYVNLEDSSAVVTFDARTLNALYRWSLAPGEEPTGLALDRVHHRLFAGCANKKLIVLDASSGKRVAVLPIGASVDGVAFDSERQLVLSSNGDGTLTVIHEDTPDKYTVVENAATERGGRTLALDASSGTVYIPTAKFGPPPAPTADRPHPRPAILPGTFHVMVIKQ
jgi:DNA-binding beta-propeller fold protein YncE